MRNFVVNLVGCDGDGDLNFLLNMPTPDSVVGAKACISGSLLQEVALHFALSLTAHRVIQMAPDYATKDGTLAHLHAVLFTHCS